MQYKWIIYQHHIAIEAEDEILHPDAGEIFSFVTGDHDYPEIPNPLVQMSFLRFSKVGAPIKCEIQSDDNNSISLHLFAIRKNKRCTIDLINGHIIDHGVADNEWFYLTGNIESIQVLLANAGILESGPISIGQYFALIRQEFFLEHKEVTNLVDDSTVKKLLVPDGLVPAGIAANLYPYQKTGFLWIKNMLQISQGCILGDEMGLGKTLQIITVFQDLKDQLKVPMLVVAPVSLLENWKRECTKFAPNLDVFVHHGAKRTGRASELTKHDVIIISYNTAVSDLAMLKMIDWWCVVLDEAQNIKNPYSERAKSVKAITKKSGVAVTGTPFENHITDIWSLVDFAVPGLLGTLGTFQQNVSDDVLGAQIIEPILSPIMIRRQVKEVANDLPEKVIIPQPLAMSDSESHAYEAFRIEANNAANGNSAVTLSLLQKLRMFCTHRMICEGQEVADPYETSIKYQRFCEILEEIISLNEKVIVFTSYKKMFDIFSQDIPTRFGINVKTINGETPVEERQRIVDWFNAYDGSVMLALNPRAAGTGLNITGANHVIHYNLEWNPSLEDQASARAYRRGQEKTVFVYRLFYVNTVEQVVNERIERKRDIATAAVVGTDGIAERNDILKALTLAPDIQKKGNN